MKKTFSKYIIFFILVAGCSSGSSIESFHKFPSQQWQHFENLFIDINIEHPGIFYNMWLELHYTSFFDLDNFPVTIIMYTPSGEIRSRDLILKFNTEDDKYSEPGKLRVLLRKDFAFPKGEAVNLKLRTVHKKLRHPGLSQ